MPPLTKFDVELAARLHAEGETLGDIAKRPGMPKECTISSHLRRRGHRVWLGHGRVPEMEASELRRMHIDERMNCEEIARVFGCGASTVRRRIRSLGFSRGRGKGRIPRGENHWSWRGGTYTNNRGYVFVYDPSHGNAMANGYVAAHRRAGAEKIGRPLTRDEEAHHINGDKMNNTPENIVVTQRGPHQRLHAAVYRELLQLRAAVAAAGIEVPQ